MNSTFRSGFDLLQFVGELAAVHRARHDHVGEQQIECVARLDDGERLRRIRGFQRDVAQRTQLRQHIVAHQPVVFDHQDGFVAAFDGAAASAPLARPAAVPGGRYIRIVVPWPSSL